MADVHARNGCVLVAQVHDKWRQCLLETAREYDPRLTAELERKRAKALKKTTDFFTERY